MEPQGAPKAGCSGTSSQQAQPLNAPSGARGKLEGVQHSSHLPKKQEELCTDVMDSPGKGEAVIALTPLGYFQTFERIFL